MTSLIMTDRLLILSVTRVKMSFYIRSSLKLRVVNLLKGQLLSQKGFEKESLESDVILTNITKVKVDFPNTSDLESSKVLNSLMRNLRIYA